MLRRAKSIRGKHISATDGAFGRVDDLYFDDHAWVVRYMVADTGGWISGRQVLIAPEAIDREADAGALVAVKLTKQQIETAPGIDADRPVSRQQEQSYRDHFEWTPYGIYESPLGPGFSPPPLPPMEPPATKPQERDHSGDPHLRSMNLVMGYRLEARGEHIGHVDDFVIDDDRWSIPYLVVHTRDWLPGKRVLIEPRWVTEINFYEGVARVDLDRERIKGAPSFDDTSEIDDDYESRLRSYFQAA